ncbi:MAG: methyltransferase domain-containing protein [Bacteroidota bacterium]|nr:methyltransferase domain-containing protein [Bacteroidota bacterium]
MKNDMCCVTECDRPLDQNYWDSQYKSETTGWDLGMVSPPIQSYFEKVQQKDARILIPGCGNTYEAEYLLQNGFTNITVIDIAPTLVETLKLKFDNNKHITIILGDFFELNGTFDYIIEQTFFCALPPTMRQKYVWKMHQLLANHGQLVGLLFNREFEINPPFGGSADEYRTLFNESFKFNHFSTANNSIINRANTELLIDLEKIAQVEVNLYQFTGITCNGCKETITQKISKLPLVLNVSINSAFNEVLIVSNEEISISLLQETISYDSKYKIEKQITNK